MLLIDPDHFDPRDLTNPFSPYFLVVYQRTDDSPPPPKRPDTWRRTFTKPGPRWIRRRWLDPDMESWLP